MFIDNTAPTFKLLSGFFFFFFVDLVVQYYDTTDTTTLPVACLLLLLMSLQFTFTLAPLKVFSSPLPRKDQDTSQPCRPTHNQMLALTTASASYAMPNRGITMPNPLKSAALLVTELSTVGFDRPARTAQLQDFERSLTAPLRAVQRTKDRVANHICMTVGATEGRVGDFGFDPLGLGTDENFASMREAEIKHGRLAMLAALAWPLQEILHPVIVDNLYALYHVTVPDVLMESNGASPSLLNGGLDQGEVIPALALALIGASVIEETDIARRANLGLARDEYPADRTEGDLGFDPLKIYTPLSAQGQRSMRERELCNGRVAMLAVLSYVATEAITGVPVVRFSQELFQPIIFNDAFRGFLDGAFGMATMEGSVNGIAI